MRAWRHNTNTRGTHHELSTIQQFCVHNARVETTAKWVISNLCDALGRSTSGSDLDHDSILEQICTKEQQCAIITERIASAFNLSIVVGPTRMTGCRAIMNRACMPMHLRSQQVYCLELSLLSELTSMSTNHPDHGPCPNV